MTRPILLKDSDCLKDNGYLTHGSLANLEATPFNIAAII
jgi:hypothetical protein